MSLPSADELLGVKPAKSNPCALCGRGPATCLVFGNRLLCDACLRAWIHADVWPEDRVHGSIAPVFETWFASRRKARAA